MFHVAFVEPRIPSNTGNAIRMVAATGAHLHLVEPLGFDLTDAKLRRAGLDYHDLATVTVHHSLRSLWDDVLPASVYAFTTRGDVGYADIAYRPGDVLMFGAEPDGLAGAVLADPNVTARVRIPMLAGRRSMNLSNCAAVATFEAWRQHSFHGS
ncbi:MAG: tRNA (cytidine(34)-2'-O)-methyltransferase [Jatrophihabitantaceae bacterium]